MLNCKSQGFFIIANENTSWHGCLPPQLAPSACTLVWTDEGTGSLGAGSWGVSSGAGRNAEHRSVSRACSFNKEFCRQKQNIGLDREQQNTAIALQLTEPISSACKGVFHYSSSARTCKRTNVHYSTSFLTSGYLSPNLYRLFMTRGKDDFVSKRRFILGSQTEMVSLFLVLKQYIKQVFHSLGWHHDLMTLCPSPFTIHKKQISLSSQWVQYAAVNNELLRTSSLVGFLEELFFNWLF